MGRQLYVKDPAHKVRFRLRPGAQTNLFQSTIRINSGGFRGPEFSDRKGDTFRIVCLGESTTFGCTLSASDKPWPELLEDKIRSRLNLGRPVEVINAGTPSFTLEDNLARLQPDILPLEPDMLISYHGFNGFPLLHDSFPVTAVSAPPAYIERPVRLLAQIEYKARLLLFRGQLTARLRSNPPTVRDLLDTDCGRAYERLIDFARTNQIRLALATHAMAVNRASAPDVIEFYRAVFPTVHWFIEANRLHSELIEQLCAMHPETRLIDVSKALDGQHTQFIDLVHLTQEGRERLAENVFQAINTDFEAEKSGR
jgi:lysophospholipase L1-like esterase